MANLGNVVGLIKSATPPGKTYVLWAKEMEPTTNPDAVVIHYYDYTTGEWVPSFDFTPIPADPDGFWPAFNADNTFNLWVLNKLKGLNVTTALPTPAAPRIISQSDTDNTLVFEAPAGYVITDCGYSIKGAATVSAISGTIQLGNVALAPNEVRIFVRGTSTWQEGRSAYNTVAYTVAAVGNTTPDAPTLVAQNDTANTFQFAPPAGFTATQCVYTLKGSAPAFCPSDTLQVGDISVAPGELQVYVPAGPGRNQGDVLSNVTAFTQANLVQPTAPDITEFDDAANTFRVSHPNWPISELVYDLPNNAGNGLDVPATGIVSVGNITGQVAVYVKSADGRAEGAKRLSTAFTTSVALAPAPTPPDFTAIDDTRNTVIVSHPDFDFSELRYDLPAGGGTGLVVPDGGLINAGNIEGQIAAYVRGTSTRAQGRKRYSQPFTLAAVAANTAPVVTFNAPAGGSTVTKDQPLVLTATATDDKAVVAMEFLNGATGVSLGTGVKNGTTYTLPYTPTVAGPLSLQARATDAEGLPTTVTNNITVQAPPTVTYTGSYTAVLADYQQKCSVAPPSGYVYPTGSGTSTVSQAAADAAAKVDAVSKITCPVPLPTYNMELNAGNVEDGGIAFAPGDGNERLQTNRIAGANAAPISMVFNYTVPASYADMPGEYAGQGFVYYDAAGIAHQSTFLNGTRP